MISLRLAAKASQEDEAGKNDQRADRTVPQYCCRCGTRKEEDE